ncbi:MAG TPA: DUF448 domain-containing protein [Clostridiaceae bacterium]|nr:DUF448 domain-containing protein [Clostridiaceae bacterium]
MQRVKKIPLRKCLGCQEMKPKKELVRIVRAAHTDEIKIDIKGKMAGRGAYICRNSECFEKAYKTKRIEKALEREISPEIYEVLKKEIVPVE